MTKWFQDSHREWYNYLGQVRHPSGYLAAGFFASIISGILFGKGLADSIETALGQLRKYKRYGEVSKAVRNALKLAERGDPTPDKVALLGEGWVAEEALAIALYCALVAESFEEGVILAANHGGDSDSTGAMAGNILGTLMGKKAIPDRWLSRLELREEIGMIAADLYKLCFPR